MVFVRIISVQFKLFQLTRKADSKDQPLFTFQHNSLSALLLSGFNSLGAIVKQVFLLAEPLTGELSASQRPSVERLSEHHCQHRVMTQIL